jgi:2-(1,2-epoxy-1,2-dihydrophenyl)acetyl-CoA isomerase
VEVIARDEVVRTVLLAGRGRMFCAGGDLRSMYAAENRGSFVHALALAAHDAVRALATLRKPIVAAVRGSAAGAGLSLALLADIVLADPGSSFLTAYTSVGLTPDCGQSWLLPRAVGTQRALELTLMPRRVSAEEAHALGIVSRVVAERDLIDEATAVAERLAAGPAHALGEARALIREAALEGFDAHLDLEAATIARMAASAEAGSLIASFFAPHQ